MKLTDVRLLLPLLLGSAALAGCAAPSSPTAPPVAAAAPKPTQPTVGGAAMDPALPIFENLAKSADHGTLVRAFRAAGLADRLPGPVTLFAPTNQAFAQLPQGTLEALMAPENKALLTQVLNYHAVSGAKTGADIAADAKAGGGTAVYRTLQGGSIRVASQGERLTVIDTHGNRTAVTIPDVRHANGVVHVVDALLLPAT